MKQTIDKSLRKAKAIEAIRWSVGHGKTLSPALIRNIAIVHAKNYRDSEVLYRTLCDHFGVEM